jgi:diguanylate cyclase
MMTDSMQSFENHAIRRAALEWSEVASRTDPIVRDNLRSVLQDRREDVATLYVAYLENDPEIAEVVSTHNAKLIATDTFLRCVESLLALDHDAVDAFCQSQSEIGRLMARVGLPPHALSRGMRKLKIWFILQLRTLDLPADRLLHKLEYLIAILDIAVEIREESYLADRARQVRIEEAYRLQALGQNLAMERERQRASLMDWLQDLLTRCYQYDPSIELPRLGRSDFGLWVNHKAMLVFDGAEEIPLLSDAIVRIDRDVLVALETARHEDRATVATLIGRLQQDVSSIKYALTALFEARLELENGRDALTQLLNRRFLPTVMMREVSLQKTKTDRGFCVAMLDIDRFKSINDQHGHLTGDAILQQVGAAIVACARPSDFVFRYGGEEIAVVLIDSNQATGLAIAERIRRHIEDMTVTLPSHGHSSVTVSIGIAAYAGELDYETLLARADKALYEAKSSGRNRVVASPIESLHP